MRTDTNCNTSRGRLYFSFSLLHQVQTSPGNEFSSHPGGRGHSKQIGTEINRCSCAHLHSGPTSSLCQVEDPRTGQGLPGFGLHKVHQSAIWAVPSLVPPRCHGHEQYCSPNSPLSLSLSPQTTVYTLFLSNRGVLDSTFVVPRSQGWPPCKLPKLHPWLP